MEHVRRRVVRGAQQRRAPRDRRGPERPTAVEADLLRPRIGRSEIRKVFKLFTIRVASARYSVPSVFVATRVEAVTYDGVVRVYPSNSGDLVAVHDQVGPGESSILDEHYPSARKAPSRGPPAWPETGGYSWGWVRRLRGSSGPALRQG